MLARLKHRLSSRLGMAELRDHAKGTTANVDALRLQLDEAQRSTEARLVDVAGALESFRPLVTGSVGLDRWQRVAATSRWCARAPLRHHPVISVVMPTRDRSHLVTSAVRSVLEQTYDRWQLVVVDDASGDDTTKVLDEVLNGVDTDHHVRVETSGVGAAAARNAGVTAATGDWVAFLDDDNVMDPGWLRAIAEFTGRERDVTSFFGAQLRDDVPTDSEVPRLLFEPDRTFAELCLHNSIDLGMVAVRRDHPELHFDETLRLYEDWDLVVRLWGHDPMRSLAALSGYYTTAAATRVTDGDTPEDLAAMQQRLVDRFGLH